MASEIPQYDFVLKRGDTLERITFVMEDADAEHISFTGHTGIKAQMRIGPNVDGEPLLEFECGVNVDGDLYIQASSEDTALVGAITSAVWDLESVSGGKKHTRIGGKVEIDPDVTQ